VVGADRPSTDNPQRIKEPIMKAYALIVAASVLAFAGSTFAQEAESDAWKSITSTQSRADVLADLQKARATGMTRSWSAGYMEKMSSTQSREQVASAARSARSSGELDLINAEAFHFGHQLPSAKADTRLAQATR
jgi:hypothetical protein